MTNFKSSFLALCAISTLTAGCMDIEKNLHLKKAVKPNNHVTNESPHVNQMIGDNEVKIQVLSESSLKDATLNKTIVGASDLLSLSEIQNLPHGEAAESISEEKVKLKPQDDTLYIGFPLGLIGEQNVFGGVITQVTDQESESLGTLKLTDLSPIHVRTVISGLPDGNAAMTLVGCFSKCDEDSSQKALLNFPIVGYNKETKMLVLEMSEIGKELDLIKMLDPDGKYTKLQSISSATTAVDYDMKTLIFDIKTKMIPVDADPSDNSIKTTDFTVRWYLKLGSSFNPAFTPRSATEGVGFFKTERASSPKITRFSTTSTGTSQAPVKYFIKNVPEEFKAIFSKAMEAWNKEFLKILGRKLISYEFIDANDPKAKLLVTGDIRYNIIEWDLVNRAGYGGLGPSVANQYTGETMSANVLIQGPTIVRLYKQWFGVSEKAKELIAQGKNTEANRLMRNFNVKAMNELEGSNQKTFKLKLGKHLDMTVHAQRPELEDPIKKGHFELIPEGMTYEKYMEGYMMEIVAHEIGHNLGLRHNFKGNLGAYENNADPGSVSRSVMEYLGRPYRHLNTIGNYDRMAIAYGYNGVAPKHLNWFCTDEDQASASKPATFVYKSPECTKSDATSDPFSFWEGRINRIIDLLIETQSASAPVWKVADVKSQIEEATSGLSAYAISAMATSKTWTNFFGKNDRPDDLSEIKTYVLQRLKNKLCNPMLSAIIMAKESAEAQKLAQDNLTELSQLVAAKAVAIGAFSAEELNCAE